MDKLIRVIEKLSVLRVKIEESAKEQFNLVDLTHTQLQYLETINQINNPNITELALEMKLTKPSVTVAVDRLIEKGYVRKVHSDEDRRSLHLHLTEKGKLISKMHEFAHRQIAESIQENLSSKELKQFVEILEKLIK